MQYITQIKAFMDLAQLKRLSTGQIALWYALMYINNKCRWQEWFTVPNFTLESCTGLTRRAIFDARNVLKQSGLIDFKQNGNGKATTYKMIPLIEDEEMEDTLLKSSQLASQPTSHVASHVTSQPTSHVTSQLASTLIRQDIDIDYKEKESKKEKELPDGLTLPPVKRFVKPTLDEVTNFCREQKLENVNPQDFWDYYESNGWKVGKQSMKNWQAAIRRWDRNEYSPAGVARGKPGSFKDYPQRNYSKEELESLFEEAERF